jgi:Uncharacterized protein conserved in bacteria
MTIKKLTVKNLRRLFMQFYSFVLLNQAAVSQDVFKMTVAKDSSGVPVSERFPHPAVGWSYENGQKAYEMMSCNDGLLDLYKVTGEQSNLKAVEMAVQDIIDEEINIAGSGSAFECWYKGAKYQDEPTYHTMETCVTMSWVKLCFNLLQITCNPAYADEIEKLAYNALLYSMKYDGSMIAKYSPMGGIRHKDEEQCGMHINCCNDNGPCAFMMLPRFAVTNATDGIYINIYCNGEASIPHNSKDKVIITQETDYPLSDKIEITVNPEKPGVFTIALRIPSWSRNTVLTINGEAIPEVTPAIVLARDAWFKDGFVYESAVIRDQGGYVDLKPSASKPP